MTCLAAPSATKNSQVEVQKYLYTCTCVHDVCVHRAKGSDESDTDPEWRGQKR